MTTGTFRRLAAACSRTEARLNRSVAATRLGRYFKLDARNTSFTKELRAGTATFLTMAYTISVNAAILTDSGGTCSVHDCTPDLHQGGHQRAPGPECVFQPNHGYEACLARTKKDLVAATSLVSMIGSLAMGSLANLPLALAPGMGSNAYFTYNMVGFHGSGPLNYETALAAVLLEGCIFLLISALGLRSKLARLIPRPIRLATAAGIGLFLAFTGLQAHQGLGLVGPSKSTLVTLAACTRTDPATGECVSGVMQSPTFWLGAVGFMVTGTCLAKEIKGSMIYGIVFVTLVSWFRNTSVTIFPDTPGGNSSYDYFRRAVDFHVVKSTAGKITFTHFLTRKIWIPLLTLLYVDVLDTTGSMYSMAEYGGFTDEKGRFEGEYRAFIADASTTIVSAALGTTTVTTYLESTAGIKEGGRTGITAITVAFYFMLSLFFTPLFTSVPPWAVGPSLVLVGVMMMRMVKEIEWGEMKEAVPAFLTMVLMPMTFSIANGIVAGLGVYLGLNMWDYVVGGVRWVKKMREMMKEARNQVSAAAGVSDQVVV